MATHTLANIRHDLVAAQSAVTNLLCKVQSVPTAPSWRFPEKTAVSVVLEDLLGDVPQASDETEGEARLFLMELLVDRWGHCESLYTHNKYHDLFLLQNTPIATVVTTTGHLRLLYSPNTQLYPEEVLEECC